MTAKPLDAARDALIALLAAHNAALAARVAELEAANAELAERLATVGAGGVTELRQFLAAAVAG